MSTFDESKHRRHQDGRFANKPHSEAEGVSLAATPERGTPEWVSRVGNLMRPDTPHETLVAELNKPWPANEIWDHPTLTAQDFANKLKTDNYALARAAYNQRMKDPNIDAETIAALAASKQPNEIRLTALTHPNLPDRVRRRVEASPVEAVRVALARNPATSSDTLYGYLQEGGDVGFAAAQNPNLSATHIRDAFEGGIDAETSRGLAANPQAPTDILDALAHRSEVFRSQVAANPSAPIPTLTRFACDGADEVTQGQALGNPSTPATVVNEVVTGLPPTSQALLRSAANHPGLTRENLAKVAAHHPWAALAHPNMDAAPHTPTRLQPRTIPRQKRSQR